MVKQYPYQLQILTATDNGQDQNGNSLPPTEAWEDYCLCRDEVNSGGRQVSTVDGIAFTFSALIQMPKGSPAIEAGSKVRVVNGTEIRMAGTVITSRQDQLHSRAWV